MSVQIGVMNIIVAMREALERLIVRVGTKFHSSCMWGPKWPPVEPVFDSHAISPCYANKIGATA